MFESIIGRIRKPASVEWSNPKYITLTKESEDKNTFTVCKGAETFICKELDIKPNVSKEVYKLSPDIWKQLVNLQLNKVKDEMYPFSFEGENTIYITDDNNNLIDVFISKDKDRLEEFKQKLDKYILDITTMDKTRKFFTDGKDGTIKLICYDKNLDITTEPYTPVVMMELNTKKSKYDIYTGILIYSTFTFIPSFTVIREDDKFSDFVYTLDIDLCLQESTQQSENLYETYQSLMENDTEISARELVSLLKHLGYKLQLKDDCQLGEIENLTDENSNLIIQNFFNTFTMSTNETATDILNMSDFKRFFRYNKLTFMDVLQILSKEYLTYDGSKITAQVLAEVIYDVYAKRTDKSQAVQIEQEMK